MSSVSSSATETPARAEQSDNGTDGLLTRIRSTLARGRRRLRAAIYDDEPSADPEPPDATATLDLEPFPDRAYPLTYPGRELADSNTTDVVGIETDAGLRLSVPENPDATIVSDQWVLIER